ncbi:MAG: PAS domain S-box protein [Deltaproteobacteria bacterium]|nr:PAS domain S-box protein [Deltaproteobacteria bacterium]
MLKTLLDSNIVIIGGGSFCKLFLLTIFSENFDQKRPAILGVADENPQAIGLRYAKEKGIFTTSDYTRLFKFKNLDLIIELTKDNTFGELIRKIKPPGVIFIDHFETRAIWEYLQIENEKTRVLRKLHDRKNNVEKVEDLFEQFCDFIFEIARNRNEYSQKIRKDLISSQRATAQIVEGSTIPTFVINMDHIVTHWNKACEKLTGYPADGIVGTNKHWKPFRAEERPIMADIILDQVMDGDIDKLYGAQWSKSDLIEDAYEAEEFFPHLGKNGKWLFFTAAPIKSSDGKIIGAIETLWDKTEEKEAEKARERHMKKLTTMLSIYTALSAQQDIDNRINTAILEIINILSADAVCIYLLEDDEKYHLKYSYGYSEDICRKTRVADANSMILNVAEKGELLIIQDISKFGSEELEALGKEGLKSVAYTPIGDSEAKVSGVLRVASRSAEHFTDEEKNVLELLANRISVTIANSMLQEELRRDAEFQARLIESAANGIVATDHEWKIVTFNPEAERIFGYSGSEVIKKMEVSSIYSPEMMDIIKNRPVHNLNNGELPWKELSIISKSGENIPVRFSGMPLFEDGIVIGSVAFFQDLREIKRLEKEVLRSERLAAVGQTVAAMAHDIKNLLYGFKGGSHLVDIGLDKNDPLKLQNGWQIIKKNISRTSDLVLDLLAYSKEREPEYESCYPNKIADDVCELFIELANENNIEIVKDFSSSVSEVVMDTLTIHRVLSNLVSNAIDACIFDKNSEKHHRVNLTISYEKGNIVRFDVKDNGLGMSDEVREKMFISFFSTKGAKGTGLGLLVTSKLIEEHNGTLDVISQPGEGSVFTVRLPFKAVNKN